MSNSAATIGTILLLSRELGDLKEPSATIRAHRSVPAVSWDRPGTETHKLTSACEWLIACSPEPLAAEQTRRFEIHPAPLVLPRNDLRLDVDLVEVSETEMLHCYVEDYDRYIGWASERLNGLFGFLQAIIWRRWTEGPLLMRLAAEPVLPELTKTVLTRYQEAQQRKVAALEGCWNAVAAMFSDCKLVYAMLHNDDVQGLERAGTEALNSVGINADDIAQYLTAFKTGATDSFWLKQFCKHRIVYHVLMERLGAGTFDWHSPEYWKFTAEAEPLKKKAKSAAMQYYVKEFHRFCLSEPVVALANGLFSPYQMKDSRPYKDLIKELVANKKPLSQEQQRR